MLIGARVLHLNGFISQVFRCMWDLFFSGSMRRGLGSFSFTIFLHFYCTKFYGELLPVFCGAILSSPAARH